MQHGRKEEEKESSVSHHGITMINRISTTPAESLLENRDRYTIDIHFYLVTSRIALYKISFHRPFQSQQTILSCVFITRNERVTNAFAAVIQADLGTLLQTTYAISKISSIK